jgi:hypothetical protein
MALGCLILVIWSCSTTKVAKESLSLRDNALAASSSGDFDTAVQSWATYFDSQNQKNLPVEVSDFVRAASDAQNAGNEQFTLVWYEQARQSGYNGADMHVAFMHIFRKQNNLSRELTALKALDESFPETAARHRVNSRLFGIYMEIDREKAFEQWKNVPVEERTTEPFLSNYFILCKQFDQKEIADSVAAELLKLNDRYIPALEWMAEKLYWQAETQYQSEMEKYNRNRTHVQYTFLINQLKSISEDFRSSRDYFERLWALEKSPRYAAFLANIYSRLDNPDRANHFKRISEAE